MKAPTAKAKSLYWLIRRPHGDAATLGGLENKVLSVHRLDNGTALPFPQKGSRLQIDLNNFTGILRFGGVGSWASSANLAIWNWKGINQYGTPVGDGVANRNIVFTNAASPNDLTNYLNRISFYSDSGSSFVGNAFEDSFTQSGFATGTEIIAVPEPETYLTGVLLILGATVQYLRHRAKRKALEGHRPA